MKTRCTSAGSSWFIRKLWPAFALLIISAAAWHRRSLSAGDDCPRSMWDLGRSRTPQTLRGIAGNLSLPSKFLIMFQLFNIKNPLLPLFSRLSQHAALLVRREHCHGAFSARTRSAHHLKRDRWGGDKIKQWSSVVNTAASPFYPSLHRWRSLYTISPYIFIQCISMKIAKNGNFWLASLGQLQTPPVLLRNSAQTRQQNESPDLSWNQKNLCSVYIYRYIFMLTDSLPSHKSTSGSLGWGGVITSVAFPHELDMIFTCISTWTWCYALWPSFAFLHELDASLSDLHLHFPDLHLRFILRYLNFYVKAWANPLGVERL